MSASAFPASWKLTEDEQKLLVAMLTVEHTKGYLAAIDDVISGKISPNTIQRLRLSIEHGRAVVLAEQLKAQCEPPRPKLEGN